VGDVVGLIVPGWHNVPGVLRTLADEIEDGDYGALETVVIAARTDDGELETWSCGPMSDAPDCLLLYAMAYDHFLHREDALGPYLDILSKT
jgi:hypothetical protein